MQFHIEVVWNRESRWSQFNARPTLEEAIACARMVENSGDGARVKKTRIVDDKGNVVWQYGKMVEPPPAANPRLPPP